MHVLFHVAQDSLAEAEGTGTARGSDVLAAAFFLLRFGRGSTGYHAPLMWDRSLGGRSGIGPGPGGGSGWPGWPGGFLGCILRTNQKRS